ncbi:hypothetical protein CsatB_010653 [Cannabis sativa]
MNVLDSPLEALVFNYVSFGFFTFVNNLWTWVAVLTAAVSFWKIRATTVDGPPGVSPSCDDRCSITPSAPPPTEPASALASASVSGHVAEDNGADNVVLTKGRKFSLYYEINNGELTESDGGVETVVVEEYCGDDNCGVGGWWERSMLKRRLDEKSWYRYQDLTELNGNVVRLWDDDYCRISSSSLVRKTATTPY